MVGQHERGMRSGTLPTPPNWSEWLRPTESPLRRAGWKSNESNGYRERIEAAIEAIWRDSDEWRPRCFLILWNVTIDGVDCRTIDGRDARSGSVPLGAPAIQRPLEPSSCPSVHGDFLGKKDYPLFVLASVG